MGSFAVAVVKWFQLRHFECDHVPHSVVAHRGSTRHIELDHRDRIDEVCVFFSLTCM